MGTTPIMNQKKRAHSGARFLSYGYQIAGPTNR